MRIAYHIEKINSLERTLQKLNREEDYIVIIETTMLICSHYINAAMHKLNTLRQDKDIKHNKMGGQVKRDQKLGKDSNTISDAIFKLEALRPGHVYGRKSNGKYAAEALKLYHQIKTICERILHE